MDPRRPTVVADRVPYEFPITNKPQPHLVSHAFICRIEQQKLNQREGGQWVNGWSTQKPKLSVELITIESMEIGITGVDALV